MSEAATKAEAARWGPCERYLRTLTLKDPELTLVAGNIRAFHAWLFQDRTGHRIDCTWDVYDAGDRCTCGSEGAD